jgi:hypothetical protein
MENFIQKINELRQQRKLYDNKFTEIQKQKKLAETKIKESVSNNFYQNKPLTIDELNHFGKNISAEYSVISKESIDDMNHGIPHKLFNNVASINFDLDLKFYKSYGDRWETTADPNVEMVTEKQKKISKKMLTDSASDNCQKIYYLCLEKITELGIDIYGIKKDLVQFKNRNWSGVCGGTTPYIFCCKKNHYEFEIEYEDDCDCYPGILYVRNIYDTINKTNIETACDLFFNSRSVHVFNNLMLLLSSKNFDDYCQQNFGYLLELIELLKQSKYKIIYCAEELIKKNCTEINNHDFHFCVKIINEFGKECLLVPHAGHQMKEYLLYLCPTLEEINQRDIKDSFYYETKKVDINTFNHSMYPKFSFRYRSSKDFAELTKCIDCFFDYKNKNYGYFENGEYFNEHFVHKSLFEKKNEEIDCKKKNMRLNFYCRSNNYSGPDFDIVLIYSPDSIWSACERNHLNDMVYPFDKYLVRFAYDKKTDANNCQLTIEGKWYDITPFVDKFYKSEDKSVPVKHNDSDIDSDDEKISEISKSDDQVYQVADKFEFTGEFSKCFDLLMKFHQALN